jgi:hypothetical protein
MIKSLETVSKNRKRSLDSPPAGMTHSISKTLPFSAIAFLQFRNRRRARSFSQLTRKLERT